MLQCMLFPEGTAGGIIKLHNAMYNSTASAPELNSGTHTGSLEPGTRPVSFHALAVDQLNLCVSCRVRLKYVPYSIVRTSLFCLKALALSNIFGYKKHSAIVWRISRPNRQSTVRISTPDKCT